MILHLPAWNAGRTPFFPFLFHLAMPAGPVLERSDAGPAASAEHQDVPGRNFSHEVVSAAGLLFRMTSADGNCPAKAETLC